ncbi:hypothetical protein LIER_30341 [Lithospermum erythrorhizon]|uniref:Encoded peptide n=1 Tax=Lithospermum erythrorhizon TaxID=34254 RepID=A0AAV3RRB8_LITER
MAFTKMIYIPIFLIIISSQSIQLAEGRHMKLKKGHTFPILVQSQSKSLINNVDSSGKAEHTNVVGISTQTTPPTESRSQQTLPPPPSSDYVDDFRPTTPGHSPGIGHSVHN